MKKIKTKIIEQKCALTDETVSIDSGVTLLILNSNFENHLSEGKIHAFYIRGANAIRDQHAETIMETWI